MAFLDLHEGILSEFADAQQLATESVDEYLRIRRAAEYQHIKNWRIKNRSRYLASRRAWYSRNSDRARESKKDSPSRAADARKAYRMRKQEEEERTRARFRQFFETWTPPREDRPAVAVVTCPHCDQLVELRKGCARPVVHRCAR